MSVIPPCAAPPDARPPDARPPGSRALFLAFLATGVTAFGGALPMLRRMIVERRRWLTAAEFTELLALCQFLPGPNAVNLTVAVGARFRGVPGALAALAGLLAAPMAIVIGLGSAYARYGTLPLVQQAFAGLAAAASGLFLATACKIAWPLRSRSLDVAIAVAAFAAIALAHLPLLPTMLILVPMALLLQRRVAA